MGIFKCLQRLWRFSRGSRLSQWLFITGSLVFIIGTLFLRKSPPETCFKNKEVVFFFHSSIDLTPRVSIPIKSIQVFDDLEFTDVAIKGTKWKIAALNVLSVGDLMAELSMKGGEKCLFPMIVVVQDSVGAEYLIIGNEGKQISLSSINYLVEHNMPDNKRWIKVIIAGPRENDQQPLSLCIEMQ